jgi:hypothetical protein
LKPMTWFNGREARRCVWKEEDEGGVCKVWKSCCSFGNELHETYRTANLCDEPRTTGVHCPITWRPHCARRGLARRVRLFTLIVQHASPRYLALHPRFRTIDSFLFTAKPFVEPQSLQPKTRGSSNHPRPTSKHGMPAAPRSTCRSWPIARWASVWVTSFLGRDFTVYRPI